MGVGTWMSGCRVAGWWHWGMGSTANPEGIPQKGFVWGSAPFPAPLQPEGTKELLLLSAWKRRPYRIKITGKRRQCHLAASERAGDHAGIIWGRLHSSFPTHSWDISNHNCEWHPAAPFWDRVPSINAQSWICRLQSSHWNQLKHSPAQYCQSCCFTQGPLTKNLYNSDVQSTETYLLKIAFLYGSQQKTRGKKWCTPPPFVWIVLQWHMHIINYGEQKMGLLLRIPLHFSPLSVSACSHNSEWIEVITSNSAHGPVCSVSYHAFLSDCLS